MVTNYYKEKLEQGLTYQDFVVEQLYDAGIPLISYSSKKYQCLIGENKAGIEIKNDNLFRKYGNFYFEYAEKSDKNNANYVNSGILRNDNTWLWVQGDYEDIYVFSKKQLVIAYNSGKFEFKQQPTSKGFVMPVKHALAFYIIKHITINSK